MKLIELLSSDKPTLSCELFPPKPGAALLDAPALVRRIAALHPAYISVTCSAGGSGNGGATTADMANEAQNVNGIPALAHLTCAAATREQVHASLTDLRKLGIENILALRGDIPDGGAFPLPGGYRHASELMADIRDFGGFCGNCRHGFALILHRFVGQEVFILQVQAATLGIPFTGDHGPHAGKLLGFGYVDADDLRMGVRAPLHLGV